MLLLGAAGDVLQGGDVPGRAGGAVAERRVIRVVGAAVTRCRRLDQAARTQRSNRRWCQRGQLPAGREQKRPRATRGRSGSREPRGALTKETKRGERKGSPET